MNDKLAWVKIEVLRIMLGERAQDPAADVEQIKAAIDFSLTGSLQEPASLPSFTRAAQGWMDRHHHQRIAPRTTLLELSGQSHSPLWLRQRLLSALNRLHSHPRAALIVHGLRAYAQGSSRYWTTRSRRRFQAVRSYIDNFAAQRTRPSASLTILYL